MNKVFQFLNRDLPESICIALKGCKYCKINWFNVVFAIATISIVLLLSNILGLK